jgi:hypothetical protein
VPARAISEEEVAHAVRRRVGRSSVEKSDHRHRWLLRARRKRPRGYHTAEEGYELASPHGAYPKA